MKWGMGSVLANGLGYKCIIPGRVIPKTQKIVLDTSLFNNQNYKVRIKGKVREFKERNRVLPYNSV